MIRIINQLNDDCFSIILDRLSLVDLLNSKLVCRRWQIVVRDIVCRQKKSLKIYSKESFSGLIYDVDSCTHLEVVDDILLFDKLNLNICLSMCRAFPNINVLSLKIAITTEEIVCLLSRWKSLKSLAFFEPLQSTDREFMLNWSLVWPFIQKQISLVDLHFGNTYLHNFIEANRFDLTVFSQLEEFEIRSDNISLTNNDQFIAMLNHLNGDKIKYLIILDFLRNVNWNPLCREERKFEKVIYLIIATNFKAPVEFAEKQSTFLDFICSNFTSLLTLDIDIDGETLIEDMLMFLEKLTTLERFAIRSTEFIFKNINRENMTRLLIRLPTIAELVVNFYCTPEHFAYLCAVFTNIISLRINCLCIDCNCLTTNTNRNNLNKRKQILVNKYPWCLHRCPESCEPALARLNQLQALAKLAIFGDYCPNAMIEELQQLTSITTFDFSLCKSYRIKLLLHSLNRLARKRSAHNIKLIIHGDELNFIKKDHRLLKEKPSNLSIETTRTVWPFLSRF